MGIKIKLTPENRYSQNSGTVVSVSKSIKHSSVAHVSSLSKAKLKDKLYVWMFIAKNVQVYNNNTMIEPNFEEKYVVFNQLKDKLYVCMFKKMSRFITIIQ